MTSEIFDFTSRRQAAIQAASERRAEWEAEDAYEHAVMAAYYQFEARLKFQREQWQKYQQAMTEKRAAQKNA